MAEQETATDQGTDDAAATAPESKPAATSQDQPPRDPLGRFLAQHGLPDEGEAAAAANDAPKGDDDPQAEGTDKGNDDPPAPKGKPSDKPEAKTLTARQIRAAKELGYSDEEIDELDPEIYGKVLDQTAARIGRKMSELGKLQQTLKGKKPAQDALEDDPEADADPDSALKGWQDDEIDEDSPDVLKDVAFDDLTPYDDPENIGKLNRTIKIVQKLWAAYTEGRQEKQTAQRDEFFASIESDFPEFGKGKMADLDDDSPEAKARNDLWEEAKAIQIGYKATGRNLSDREALEYALDHIGRDTLDKAAQKDLRAKLANRRRSALPRGQARRDLGDNPTKDQKLDRALDRFEEQTGIVIPA